MRYFAAAAALAALLVCTGCMGDDGGDESFTERADEICSDAQVQISRVQQPQDPRDPLQVALFLERAVPIARAQNRRLRELERPEGEERSRVNAFLGALEAEVDAAERMLAAARREDREAVQASLQESAVTAAQARQFAEQLGMQVCGGTAREG